ncbi:MAG: hypothetical protein KJ915_12405 [Candidatus Omnitrophica bacterium]|nr:hypothetical protein [Candidatus Omnitrophota bacterium]
MSQIVFRKALLIILSLLIFSGLTSQCFSLNDSDLFGNNSGLSIEALTDRMIYKTDQEVVVTVYLKNKTEEPIDIVEPAIDKSSFMFEIVYPDGKKDKMIGIHGVKLETIRLYPKKRIKFTAKFLPETPGNYDINVKYNGYKTPLSFLAMRVFVVGNLAQKDITLGVE